MRLYASFILKFLAGGRRSGHEGGRVRVHALVPLSDILEPADVVVVLLHPGQHIIQVLLYSTPYTAKGAQRSRGMRPDRVAALTRKRKLSHELFVVCTLDKRVRLAEKRTR